MYLISFSLLMTVGNVSLNWSLFLFHLGELTALRKDVAHSKNSAYAAGTLSNLHSQWKSYIMFCLYFGMQSFPATTDVLCLYAQFLSRSFKSISVIKAYVAGVRTLHLFLNITLPTSHQFFLNLTLKGISKRLKHVPLQKLPITPDILSHMFCHLDLSVEVNLVFWTCCLFAFFLCARKSNLLPQSRYKHSQNSYLLRSDVIRTTENLVVCIKWSKTNQTNEKFLTIPLFKIKHSILCPVSAFNRMCDRVKTHSKKPMFMFRNDSGALSPLTFNIFDKMLASVLTEAGYNPVLYSGHSFRRGGATWAQAFANGFPSDAIKLLGDWKSDSFLLYIHLSFETRVTLAKKFAKSLPRIHAT
jgi:hypothetical protein